MRKSFLLAAALLLGACSTGPSAPVGQNDPYDIYVKTAATGIVPDGGSMLYKGQWVRGRQTVEDYCYRNDDPSVATPDGDGLKEYVLENGVLTFGDRACDCVDGACVRPPKLAACVDTDGGRDLFVKGRVTGVYEGEGFASISDDDCDESPIIEIDETTGEVRPTGKTRAGTMVLENFCVEGLGYRSEWISCVNGCRDGACLRQKEE